MRRHKEGAKKDARPVVAKKEPVVLKLVELEPRLALTQPPRPVPI